MAKAFRNEIREKRLSQSDSCPESIHGFHGLQDRYGKCCLCRRKIGPMDLRPAPDPSIKSNSVLAYEYVYDPDYGNSIHDTY